MIQTIAVMVGAYIFTRMFTAGIRAYPNDAKYVGSIVRLLSIITAFIAFGCTLLILFSSATSSLREVLPR